MLATSSWSIAATVNASRTSNCVAPCAVTFYDSDVPASNTSSQTFHTRSYSWDFGDSGAGEWGTDGKSKNSDIGPVAAHVYESPGTFTATLTVIEADGTAVGTDTETVVVTNPDTVYAGTLTTCISTGSTFTGCPSGATQVTTTNVATAMGYATDGHRVLFRRGDSWTASTIPSVPESDGPVTIGAFGTCSTPDASGRCSNAPTFTAPEGIYSHHRQQDIRVMDLKVSPGCIVGVEGTEDMMQQLLFRLESDGCQGAEAFGWGHYNDSSPITIDQMYIVDLKVTNSADYAGYLGAERLGFLGNTVENSGTTHLVRIWQSYRGVVSHNILSGANITSPANGRHLLKFTGPDDVEEDPEHCAMSPGTGCLANYTAFSVISNNMFGSSRLPVMITPQSPIADSKISDIIFENNKIVPEYGTAPYGVPRGTALLTTAGSYITIRNNIFDATACDNDWRGILISGSDYIYLSGVTTRNYVYNNTIYRSDANNDTSYGVEVKSGATYSTLRNNLYSDELASGLKGFILNNGTSTTQSNNVTTDNPYLVDPDNAAPLSRNYSLTSSSTALIDQGTTIPVRYDYAYSIRPINSVYDVGAYEYSEGGDTTNPVINITGPTSSATYATSSDSGSFSGSCTDEGGVASVTWACPTCTPTSGTATGTTSWNFSNTLSSGANTITVTCTDTSTNTHQDSLVDTYTPGVTGSARFGSGGASIGSGGGRFD